MPLAPGLHSLQALLIVALLTAGLALGVHGAIASKADGGTLKMIVIASVLIGWSGCGGCVGLGFTALVASSDLHRTVHSPEHGETAYVFRVPDDDFPGYKTGFLRVRSDWLPFATAVGYIQFVPHEVEIEGGKLIIQSQRNLRQAVYDFETGAFEGSRHP